MFNFGKKKQPKNPIEQLTVDELRAARVRMEQSRNKVLKDIGDLEGQKARIFQEGAATPDMRSRRLAAQRIKETEEQIKQLDQQLAFYEKQLQLVSRFEFMKRNSNQLMESGIDKLFGKLDTDEVRKYIEDLTLNGAVNMERLEEISNMLGEALNTGMTGETDPEIARLMIEMERASLGSADDLADHEAPQQADAAEAGGEPRERN